MSALQSALVTPRDMANLTMLKELGLNLVDVRISHVSFAKGQLLGNIPLPSNTRVVCVIRNGKPIVDLQAVFLEENDFVYLITDDEMLVRHAFTV